MDPDVGYFDCMSECEAGINWSFKDYNAESYMFAQITDNENILKENVLSSNRVADAIDRACEQEGSKRDKVAKKAKEIVDEIAHTFSLRTIRFMAFMLSKIVKRLFRHVYVNRLGIEKLSQSVKYAPLVLVPSHNSYFDFLLTSLVCFAVDLPLPAIASGQDFLHIAVVNRLLRGSGAFFLRRSFATDHFYKSIFTEYVQQVIKDGRMPMEFFLEGTRSRSGKALHPKTGMMSMITEMFFLGYVPDVHFCPISISYECITEEQLYVFELLGIPKPKESLSGLVKARKVLSSDYGSVHLHFGEVASLRDFCQGSINRAEYALFPRNQTNFKSNVHTKKEKNIIRKFAELLVNNQQTNMVIYPRAIIGAAVLQDITNIGDLQNVTQGVVGLLRQLGKRVYGTNGEPLLGVITNVVQLCNAVLQFSSDGKQIEMLPFEVSISDLKKTKLGTALNKSNSLATTISRVYLSLQRNKLMHALMIPSYLVAAGKFCSQDKIKFDELEKDFIFLRNVLRPDFVHPDTTDTEDIKHGLDVLQAVSYLKLNDRDLSGFVVRCSDCDLLLKFLNGLIQPFIEAYWLAGQFMTESVRTFPRSTSSLVSDLQIFAASTFQYGILKTSESVSLQTIKNSITSLIEAGCLLKSKNFKGDSTITGVDVDKLHAYTTRLGDIGGFPNIWLSARDDFNVTIKSKM